MKGKKAVQSANRRAKEAASTVEELQALLKEERAAHHRQVNNLKGEISRLRTEHAKEASALAAKEVERRLKEAEEERRRRGLSDDLAADHQYKQDRFAFNACRYLSMTEGVPPDQALPRVMTWVLDEDYYGPISRLSLLVKAGLPPDGWVAAEMGLTKHLDTQRARRRSALDKPLAYCLDRAEREQFDAIHPDYNPRWYPRMIYQGITLTDDDGNPISEADAS